MTGSTRTTYDGRAERPGPGGRRDPRNPARAVAVAGAIALLTLVAGCSSVEDALEEADSSSSSPTPTPSAVETEPGDTLSPSPTEKESPSASDTEPTDASSEPSPTADPLDPGAPPSSYEEAASYVAAVRGAGSPKAVPRFSTPGDAVYCVLRHEFIRPSCELAQGGAVEDPAACRGGLSEKVGRVEVAAGGAVAACNTDTIREPGAATVSPTSAVVAGDLACAVREIGVTCVHAATRSGFFITPGDYAVFRS